jgi:hypothetical protein
MVIFEAMTLQRILKRVGFSDVSLSQEFDMNDWIWGMYHCGRAHRYLGWRRFWRIENPVAQLLCWPVAAWTYVKGRSGRMIVMAR